MSRPDLSDPERKSVEMTSRTGLTLALIALSGVFVLMMFAASLQGYPQISASPDDRPDSAFSDSDEPIPSPTPPPTVATAEDPQLLAIIGVVMTVLIGAGILALIFFGMRVLIRFLAQLWQNRPLARQEGSHVDSTGPARGPIDVEPDTVIIRRGIAEALRAIDERTDPGEGIVAAWVGLEETAADAGAGRGANETPSEFTVRIVGRRAGIATEITTLLGLYERVRFGGHSADEAERAAASRCLSGIEAGWR